MATVDERYAEKIRARTEGRAPVVAAPAVPVVLPEGASVHERYLAKLAARATATQQQPQQPATPPAAKAEPAKAADKDDASQPADGKGEAKPPTKK